MNHGPTASTTPRLTPSCKWPNAPKRRSNARRWKSHTTFALLPRLPVSATSPQGPPSLTPPDPVALPRPLTLRSTQPAAGLAGDPAFRRCGDSSVSRGVPRNDWTCSGAVVTLPRHGSAVGDRRCRSLVGCLLLCARKQTIVEETEDQPRRGSEAAAAR